MALPANVHLNIHPFVGYCRHEYLVPPAAPVIWNFLDIGIVNGVTGLFAWPTAQFPFPPARRPERGEVLDTGFPMEGRDTDATLFVTHLPVPLVPSVLLPLIILFGSSKIIMGSNKTRIWCKGLSGLTGEVEQAVGCCVFPNFPMSLNLQCWDIKCKMTIGAPVMSDIVFAPNSVQVGIALSDYLAALIDWAIDVAIAVFLAFGTKLLKGSSKEAALAKSEAKGEKPGLLKRMKKPFTDAWDKLGTKHGAQDWVTGLGVKLPYRMLVKNTEWYRDDVQHPIEDKL